MTKLADYRFTIEDEAPENITQFVEECCSNCQSNDWYCPDECELLCKARKMDFERIRKKYIEYEGDMVKICAFIKRAKLNLKRGKKQ